MIAVSSLPLIISVAIIRSCPPAQVAQDNAQEHQAQHGQVYFEDGCAVHELRPAYAHPPHAELAPVPTALVLQLVQHTRHVVVAVITYLHSSLPA